MNKINYDLTMQNTVAGLKGKNSLLLHVCCAPCLAYPLEELLGSFDISVYFYNPNITDKEEYGKRLAALYKYLEKRAPHIPVEDAGFNPAAFYAAAAGRESEKEGGARCQSCFDLRLNKTAQTAAEKGFDYFSTVLTVSPHKNSAAINAAGERSAEKTGAVFLHSDFKKRNGYKRGIELFEKYGLYRQNYCGCEFSKASRVQTF